MTFRDGNIYVYISSLDQGPNAAKDKGTSWVALKSAVNGKYILCS